MLLIICILAVGPTPANAQSELRIPGYVGSKVCADCHEKETEAWRNSHHELAWTLPDKDNVLGDFADTVFTQSSGRKFSQSPGRVASLFT